MLLLPKGRLTMSGDIFACGEGGGTTGIQQAEARDGVKHPTMHKTAPTEKSYQVQNVNSVKAEKSQCTVHRHVKVYCC